MKKCTKVVLKVMLVLGVGYSLMTTSTDYKIRITQNVCHYDDHVTNLLIGENVYKYIKKDYKGSGKGIAVVNSDNHVVKYIGF